MWFLYLFIFLLPVALCKDWAVLVCGSKDYWNYRHQAATASAYRYFLRKGISKENIIVFSENDVSNDPLNPFPGQLYSVPGNGEENKMSDVIVEYGSGEITGLNVLNVLSGNRFSSKRVLKSSYMDTIHVAFFEYGAPGVITLPNDAIFGDELQQTIMVMNTKHMYKDLNIYIDGEGTEQLFEGFALETYHAQLKSPYTDGLVNHSIFCPPNDIVNGESIGSCLNTAFSYKWLSNDMEQPQIVYDVFNNDISMNADDVFEDVYNVRVNYLNMMMKSVHKGISLNRKIQIEINTHLQMEEYFNTVMSYKGYTATDDSYRIGHSIKEWNCYKRGVHKLENLFLWNEYSLKYFVLIVNMCERDNHSF